MMDRDWTDQQKLYIQFLAAGKVDQQGKKWNKEDFATEVLKCGPAILYVWQRLPGFRLAVFEETMSRKADYIPAMIDAQIKKSVKVGDTSAFMAMMRQFELLKADKQEVKAEVDGNISITSVDFKHA